MFGRYTNLRSSPCCVLECNEHNIELSFDELNVFCDISGGYDKDYIAVKKYFDSNVRNIGDFVRLCSGLEIFYQDKIIELKDTLCDPCSSEISTYSDTSKKLIYMYDKFVVTLRNLKDTLNKSYKNYQTNMNIYDSILNNRKIYGNISEINCDKIIGILKNKYVKKWLLCIEYIASKHNSMNETKCRKIINLLSPTSIIKYCDNEMKMDVLKSLMILVDIDLERGCYKSTNDYVHGIKTIIDMMCIYNIHINDKIDINMEEYLGTIIERIPVCWIPLYNKTMKYVGRYYLCHNILYMFVNRLMCCKICC